MSPVPARIGLVAPKSVLIIPSVFALIQALTARGYALDIYAWDDVGFPFQPPSTKNLRLFMLPQQGPLGTAVWRWQYLAHWMPYLVRQCHRQRYGCMVGLDPWGLVLASIPARLRRIPLVYFSLELLLRDRISSPYHQVLKWAERFSNRFSAFTIIQDADRARLLVRENRISLSKVVYLPNAPSGEANAIKTRVLRKTLGIDKGRWIILHAGSVDCWTKSLELARAARTWPNNLAMVFHVPLPLKTKYQQTFLTQIDGKHTYLSQGPLSLDRLIKMGRSADIGVALYPGSEQDQNMFTMGLSSGKIAHYLRCGLPVVATGLPSLRKFIEKYQCGVCIDRVEEVSSAITTVIKNYKEFSKGAIDCFVNEFQLNRHLVIILERFDQLLDHMPNQR